MTPRSLPDPVRRFVVELDEGVRSVIGDDLLSTIVHGSAALGGFVAERSDVDVLVIAATDLEADLIRRTADRIHAIADRSPGVGVELSVVTSAAVAEPHEPWPYLLHVATASTDSKTIIGADCEGDPDLLMHYAVCRSAGFAVSGPPPSQLIGEISRRQILDYLAGELTWATDHAGTTYTVLNACRTWQFAETGALVSKLDGAAWALRAGAPADLVHSAIAAQTGGGVAPTVGAARRFVARVQAIIERADRV